MLHNHLRNFTSHELGIDLNASDKADHGAYRINQLGSRIKIGSDHVGGFRDATDTVTLGESPCRCKQQRGCENESFFHASKLLIGETKNDFDCECIAYNSLIYKSVDMCHRVSSRYIGRVFPGR